MHPVRNVEQIKDLALNTLLGVDEMVEGYMALIKGSLGISYMMDWFSSCCVGLNPLEEVIEQFFLLECRREMLHASIILRRKQGKKVHIRYLL